MVKINDHFFHKKYGVCKVVEILKEEKDKFYLLKMIHESQLTSKIPAKSFEVVVRTLCSEDEIFSHLEDVKQEPLEITKRANARNTFIKNKISTGDFASLAAVMKNIIEFRLDGSLTEQEQRIKSQLDNLLFGEISFVLDVGMEQAEEIFISKTIDVATVAEVE